MTWKTTADERDLIGQIERLKAARVLCIEHETRTLGGAGNALRNLRALGATASFISVVGNDDAARETERLLAAQDGTEVHLLVQPERITTVKTRYIAANQQLLRTDRETTIPLAPHIRNDLLLLARELVTSHDVDRKSTR